VFLPHWWAPPLALLFFNLYSSYGNLVCQYFKELSEYGGVPHGTTLFAGLCDLMEKIYRSIRYDPDEADYDAKLCHYYSTYKNIVGKNKMNYITTNI
jgi:hypothetical protein